MSIVLFIVAGFAVSGGLSALITPLTIRLAPRLGAMDVPGRHKAHAKPIARLGGSAILLSMLLPAMLVLAVVRVWASAVGGPPEWVPLAIRDHVSGAAAVAPQALILLAGALALHVLGLIDDRKDLGPWIKLAVQAVVAVGVVLLVPRIRLLTMYGPALSCILTALWIITVTNAFNFLDNMDGLSAGVAAICAIALLASAARLEQLFVCGALALLAGSLVGFLPYNFHPARTYMGDAGSLVIGYLLAVLSGLTTYIAPGQPFVLYKALVPLVLLAVPLYDMVSVITLRLRDRRNPMVGDRRHFSHRLIRRGMTVRKAVLTIYLCTAATAIAAGVLPRTSTTGAVLVFVQTLIILLTVALLESGELKA